MQLHPKTSLLISLGAASALFVLSALIVVIGSLGSLGLIFGVMVAVVAWQYAPNVYLLGYRFLREPLSLAPIMREDVETIEYRVPPRGLLSGSPVTRLLDRNDEQRNPPRGGSGIFTYEELANMSDMPDMPDLPLKDDAIEPPRLADIVARLPRNGLTFAYGVDARSGTLIRQTLPEAVHIKMIGSSGFGKSCLAAAILAQLVACNTPDTVRVALLDLENKTSRPFQDVPHLMQVREGRRVVSLLATTAEEVAARLGTLVRLLNHRILHSIETPSLLIYVEEFLSLQYELVDDDLKTQMLRDFTVLAVRGRKCGMFLMGLTQTDYSTKELRDAQKQFRSRLACSVDPVAARAAGFVNTDALKRLYAHGRPGQFLFERPGASTLILAPYEDKYLSEVRRVVGGSAPISAPISRAVPDPYPPISGVYPGAYPYAKKTSSAPISGGSSGISRVVPGADRQGISDDLKAKLLAVIAEDEQNHSQNEIIRAVWQCEPNTRAGQTAAEELRQLRACMAQHLRKTLEGK